MASEPPPLPPLPPQLPPEAAAAPPPIPLSAAPSLEGRLHPFTLFFAFWNAVRNFLLPLVIVLLFRRREPDVYIWIGSLFIGLPIALALIKYFTFTYRIEHGELITKQGLLGRTERNIPLSRVQDIRIEQGVLHRMFNMADVLVETAGGRGPEASLSVLARSEAERLRAAVFEQAHAATAQAAPGAPRVEREVVRQLSLKDLVMAGITSNRTAHALAIILVLWQFVDDLLPREKYEQFFVTFVNRIVESQGNGGLPWPVIAAGAVAVIVVGMIFSVAGSIIVFYGFTLSRGGEDLHRSYGLFTRRSSSLPRRRIQLLKIEETWLRRMFKLATLRADTAGGSQIGQNKDEQSGRDVLLPVVPRAEVERLLPTFFPDLDDAGAEWQKVSRRAIIRGTRKGTGVCLLLATISCALQQSWHGLWPLLFIPAVYVLNVMSYRHLGYFPGERFFRMRSGWISRATHIVPVRNIQSVVVRQTPFDRRHRVATLLVDSAGQTHTGGGPRIGNVPWGDALTVARTLAQRAARTRYRI
jgi:putative membrane protein